MGRPELDSRIMGQMKNWGGNYNSDTGCSHNSEADNIDNRIDGRDVTINVASKMDASHAKPGKMNPGVDKGFLAKGNPQKDTVEGFTLTRKLKD